MTLEIEDGFNFAVGQWLGELATMAVSLAAALVVGGVIVLGVFIYEWLCDRRYGRNKK